VFVIEELSLVIGSVGVEDMAMVLDTGGLVWDGVIDEVTMVLLERGNAIVI
jgi:hypothetical protein